MHIANSTNWNEILSIQDPEFAVEKLIELIQECTDKATTINNNKRYNKSLVPRTSTQDHKRNNEILSNQRNVVYFMEKQS